MLEIISVGFWACAAAFACGLALGQSLEARQWREKGNHDYLNRKESAGSLYIVKRESNK